VDSPLFLDKKQILEIHALQISFFGGQDGIANEGILDSAIAAPINYFNYTTVKNLFDLAACYAFHLAKDHAFVDGNKRVGLHSAVTFLRTNGISVDTSQRRIYRGTLELTTSKIDKFHFSKILSDCAPLEFAFMANFYAKIPRFPRILNLNK
jgi:death on curing protein